MSDISETITNDKNDLYIYRIDVIENQFKVTYTSELSNLTESNIKPYAWLSYPKTTTKFSNVYNQFPLTIPYSEYSDIFQGTFSRTLNLIAVVAENGGWKATYSGTLYGSGRM
ncbi:MAG: hypothetical protein ACK5LL_17530 [Suipraeoptans sp.]